MDWEAGQWGCGAISGEAVANGSCPSSGNLNDLEGGGLGPAADAGLAAAVFEQANLGWNPRIYCSVILGTSVYICEFPLPYLQNVKLYLRLSLTVKAKLGNGQESIQHILMVVIINMHVNSL